MNFRVGQKVARVGSNAPGEGVRPPQGYSYPKVGEVCTIEAIYDWLGGAILNFVEHNNSHLPRVYGRAPGFNAKYFRPVVEKGTETGMAILRKVADDASKKRNLVTTR